MLNNLEKELLALIKANPVAAKVREVDSLPDLDGTSLVQKFNTTAPAIYIAPGSFGINGSGLAMPRYGIALIVKNAGGQKAARQGDTIAIGLNDLIDAVLAIFNGVSTDSCGWLPRGVDFVHDELLFKNSLYAAVLKVEGTEVALPNPVDETTLAHFTTFHADYDIQPMASTAAHVAWQQGDYSLAQPKAKDDVTPLP